MAVFALIGGKVNREKINNNIEKYLVSKINKSKVTVLFCPYATKDDARSISKFHSLMEGIDCDIIDLTFNNVDRFDEYLNKADILYIGGGWSDDLLAFFKENKLDKILEKYINTDKIYAGSSAGAMLLSRISMGDKYMYTDNAHNYNYKMTPGLGLLNISICPHYQNEDLIIYNDEIKEYGLLSFGLEEDTAVIIEDNKYYCIKDDKKMSVYAFSPKNGYKMTPIYEGELYEDSNIRP